MTAPLHIELPADHRRLVLHILDAHLPHGTRIWVVGSRARSRARRYSDLDLAIDAGRRLSPDELAELAEAFSDSDLPYKVDLVDWHNIDDHWRQTITAERVAMTEAAHLDRPGPSQSGGCAPGGPNPERARTGSPSLTRSSGAR